MLVVLALFVNSFAGRLEGSLAPVANNMVITKVTPATQGYSRIWGEFDLHRPGCDFAGLDWFLVGNSRDVLADLVFEEGTKEREGGGQTFGPWRIQLIPIQIADRSRAVVYHNCPWRWWKTETELYP